jgi:hypothetical protein
MKKHNNELETSQTNGVRSFTNTPGIADRYEVSPRCIQNWVARKILPVLRIGRCVRFNIAACDRALAKFERKAAGE